MDFETMRRMGDEAAVSLAASAWHRKTPQLPIERLEPRLWEALRVEMQKRWREATGEDQAILKIEETGHVG